MLFALKITNEYVSIMHPNKTQSRGLAKGKRTDGICMYRI
jgi:hypothetical protein